MENQFRAFALRALAVGAIAISAGCTVHQSEVPSLAGPSEFGLTYHATASPDEVTQDGSSRSTIRVTAFDANGKPAAGVMFRLEGDSFPLEVYNDLGWGRLESPNTATTGADGVASFVYAAPTGTSVRNGGSPTSLTFRTAPVGSDYLTARWERVQIRLVPPPF